MNKRADEGKNYNRLINTQLQASIEINTAVNIVKPLFFLHYVFFKCMNTFSYLPVHKMIVCGIGVVELKILVSNKILVPIMSQKL